VDASWNPDPGILLALALVTVAYMRRWQKVRHHHGPAAAPEWRAGAFLAGIAALLLALVSPMDRIAEQLATVHMLQHLLLLDIAPVLLLAGTTKVLLRPLTRLVMSLERRVSGLSHPAFGAAGYIATMVVYHTPPVYDLTLRSPLAHALAHMALTFAGAVYWWHLISPARQRLRMTAFGPVIYMSVTKLGAGLIAIALGFAPVLIYDAYASLPEFWGLTHLQDQRVAGLLMALEQSAIMGIALAALFVRALDDSERADRRAEDLWQRRMGFSAHCRRGIDGDDRRHV
jgi:cytochrome c oxidase assembly factor CtaG